MNARTVTGSPVELLRLPPRWYNALVRNGIDTVEQLRKIPDFASIRGVREIGVEEIRKALKAFVPPRKRS